VQREVKTPVLDLYKSKVDIRSSLPKGKGEIDANVSIPSKDAKLDIDLKKEPPKVEEAKRKETT
jgi:hypothetical protein